MIQKKKPGPLPSNLIPAADAAPAYYGYRNKGSFLDHLNSLSSGSYAVILDCHPSDPIFGMNNNALTPYRSLNQYRPVAVPEKESVYFFLFDHHYDHEVFDTRTTTDIAIAYIRTLIEDGSKNCLNQLVGATLLVDHKDTDIVLAGYVIRNLYRHYRDLEPNAFDRLVTLLIDASHYNDHDKPPTLAEAMDLHYLIVSEEKDPESTFSDGYRRAASFIEIFIHQQSLTSDMLRVIENQRQLETANLKTIRTMFSPEKPDKSDQLGVWMDRDNGLFVVNLGKDLETRTILEFIKDHNLLERVELIVLAAPRKDGLKRFQVYAPHHTGSLFGFYKAMNAQFQDRLVDEGRFGGRRYKGGSPKKGMDLSITDFITAYQDYVKNVVMQEEPMKQLPEKRTYRSYRAQLAVLMEPIKESYAKQINIDRQENKLVFSRNLAGFHALECGINIICERDRRSTMEIFEAIIQDQIAEHERLRIVRFAINTLNKGRTIPKISPADTPALQQADKTKKGVIKKKGASEINAMIKFLDRICQAVAPFDNNEDKFKAIQTLLQQDKEFAEAMFQLWPEVLPSTQDTPDMELKEETIDDMLQQIETDAQTIFLKMEFEKIIDLIQRKTKEKTASDLIPEDESIIRETAHLVMNAHHRQKRKQGLPYFVHQLDVTRTLVEVFGVVDVLTLQVALLHDTREDQPDKYDAIKDQFQAQINDIPKRSPIRRSLERNAALIRLGVRMLTHIRMKDASQSESIEHYLDQLTHPRQYYNEKIQRRNPNFMEYDDDFIKRIQLVKLADILANANDLGTIFDDPSGTGSSRKSSLHKKIRSFPERVFQKSFNQYIDQFVTQSEYLDAMTRLRFYKHLKEVYLEYLDNPSKELQTTARKSVDRLTSLIGAAKS